VEIHVPEFELTNDALVRRLNSSETGEQMFQRTGIRGRRVAAPGECASDLAVKAGQRLIETTGVDPQQIDYVLFCSHSPDHFVPSTACLIQERLGISRLCGAFDINQACAAYVCGLSAAQGMIASGQARTVLLLSGETYSRWVHPQDQALSELLADGASATLLEAADTREAGIGEFVFETDGRGGPHMMVPSGGLRNPVAASDDRPLPGSTSLLKECCLNMNGKELAKFVMFHVPRSFGRLIEKAGWKAEDVDFVVLHQASNFLMNQLRTLLPLPPEKIPFAYSEYGNTGGTSVAIALRQLIDEGKLATGQKLVLLAFGAGYSLAGCTVVWQ